MTDKEATTKLVFANIDADLHKRLKILAVESDTTVKALIEQFINNGLKEYEPTLDTTKST